MGQMNTVKNTETSIISGYSNEEHQGTSNAIFGEHQDISGSNTIMTTGKENVILKENILFINGYKNDVKDGSYNIISGTGNTSNTNTDTNMFGFKKLSII